MAAAALPLSGMAAACTEESHLSRLSRFIPANPARNS